MTWQNNFIPYQMKFYSFENEMWVGHGGSCPGYRSQLYLHPSKQIAFSVMINSSGTNPGKYIEGMYKILNSVSDSKQTSVNMYKEIEGTYISQPWNSETYAQSWGDKLGLLFMPTLNPELELYQMVADDTFRRILKNDELGEELKILRDENNNVVAYKTHQNI